MTDKFIPLCRPCLGKDEANYAYSTVSMSMVSSYGHSCQRFREELARVTGINDSKIILTNSGTSALHASLISMGCNEKSFVLCPTLTFGSTLFAAMYTGASIYLLDCPSDSYPSIGYDEIFYDKSFCNYDKYFIMPVDLYGFPCDWDAIRPIGSMYDIVADSTESLGTKYKGLPLGMVSENTCFSFNGNKIITTGQGGAVVNPRSRFKLESLINQSKVGKAIDNYYSDIGYNYKMPEICASIGIPQAQNLELIIARKKEIYDTYNELLYDIPEISFIKKENPNDEPNYWMTVALIYDNLSTVMKALSSNGIEFRRVFKPLHYSKALMEDYRIINPQDKFINATSIYSTGLCLPSSIDLTKDDQEYICDTIRKCF